LLQPIQINYVGRSTRKNANHLSPEQQFEGVRNQNRPLNTLSISHAHNNYIQTDNNNVPPTIKKLLTGSGDDDSNPQKHLQQGTDCYNQSKLTM